MDNASRPDRRHRWRRRDPCRRSPRSSRARRRGARRRGPSGVFLGDHEAEGFFGGEVSFLEALGDLPEIEGGIDLERDKVSIEPVPSVPGATVNFGLNAAKALEERKIDGFWANGMGAEVALRRGVGTLVLDVRRGDGPRPAFNFTMASVASTTRLLDQAPEKAMAAVRAIVKTQRALKKDVSRAAEVGKKLFPPAETELIVDLIKRDLPYYDPDISPAFVAGMNQFARAVGILDVEVAYEEVVATALRHLWSG